MNGSLKPMNDEMMYIEEKGMMSERERVANARCTNYFVGIGVVL